ncbi:TIGR04283 family arsenosugar biosynthesis glycosyltransferase [Croceitalea sp. MTPC9]|uniref:TIGR04283 family arsenosugar biosynthesis glycosyltransferase n=1 Tax=unclassified Croceitalea TaxID=2632280 RepID=UPI002B383898|nr:TIGR04283 family arsenosugar biosynthesis glycosyltransferase [Croceitalea sp. MTPC6]GMN17041.1 TIGR04283 family arsenosugar biosynthesis glycosyltransferase [Croceitalea sp. MTPC9]
MVKEPKISIIIPVLNEATGIGKLLDYILSINSKYTCEILLVDGGSTDATLNVLKDYKVSVFSSKRGRAAQMNFGAKKASGDILYFLHADTFPPKNFDKLIVEAYNSGAETGCFRMRFDSKNPFLRFFGWLSRINHTLCRGGDQSLFITKTLFEKNHGFNEKYLIYEDSEFIFRLYKETNFIVLPYYVITSARKYRQKGWLKVQFHFGMIHLKNYLGASPDELYAYYSKKLLT